jgi:hypothetical protein
MDDSSPRRPTAPSDPVARARHLRDQAATLRRRADMTDGCFRKYFINAAVACEILARAIEAERTALRAPAAA